VDGERPEPPDPRTATDIPAFVDRLTALWEWAGSPGYRKKFQEMANQRLGAGHLSGTTVWRVLTSRQDLTRVQSPERFVHDLVTVLGADPGPWLAVLAKLLHPAESHVGAVTDRPRRWPVRRIAVIAGVCLLVAGGVAAWSLAGDADPPAAAPPDYTRPARIESGDAALRLGIDRNGAEPGTAAVLTDDTAATAWELVAPHPGNPAFRQVRPAGKLLMCLEVVGGEFEDRARVQQWGCNGEPHQYWRPQPDGTGTMRLVNFNSGQCLTVAGVEPEAGMRAVQRTCDARQVTQHWRFPVADAVAITTTPPLPGPDPAELPGGGKARACAGIGPALDPAAGLWVNEPWFIRDEPDNATRGVVTLGAGAFGAVELARADRLDAGGRETFYWAEGWVTFTPDRFDMALQWTRVRGPGDWHTCAVPFTVEHGRPATVALPRDRDRDGVADTWFRICLTYTPEIEPSAPVVRCTGRY
jgi:hypothetical protein